MTDGDDTAASKREWVAIQVTALKASPGFMAQLADHEKLVVSQGARLTALLSGGANDHWLVTQALVDGKPTADNLRYIFKKHWKIEGDGPSAALVSSEAGRLVTHTGYSASQARHRRLYAAFRHRLSHR